MPAKGRSVVAVCALIVTALVATDVGRAVHLGIADAGLWFFAPSALLGVAAALVIGRWPDRRRMALLLLLWIAVGVVNDADWVWPQSRLAATASVLAFGLQSATYAHMVLAYPLGVIRHRLELGFVAVAYVTTLVWVALPLLFADFSRCPACVPHVNSLVYTGHTIDLDTAGRVFDVVLGCLGAVLVWLIVRRLRRDPPGTRRTQLPLIAAGMYAVAGFIAAHVASFARVEELREPLEWVDRTNSLLIPVAILVGIATIRRSRGPVGDLVVELGSARPGGVRAALARALGDPTVELALWLPDEGQWVDERGAQLAEPAASPGRAMTIVGPQSRPVAALVHHESLLDQRPLLEAVGSAAQLALENARLHAQLRSQLAELRASRRRLVSTADAERRRLERDLHDGAQQRLLALGLALQLLRDDHGDPELLHQAEVELQEALAELRALARGIHPTILTEQGLEAAVRSLVDRAPLPVDFEGCGERFEPEVEAAAYFVVSESLVNVAKHAGAERARVSIARVDGRLAVEVRDDGCGGAATAPGGGLEGLADRVGTVGGKLSVTSSPAAGTTVRAEIPCASS